MNFLPTSFPAFSCVFYAAVKYFLPRFMAERFLILSRKHILGKLILCWSPYIILTFKKLASLLDIYKILLLFCLSEISSNLLCLTVHVLIFLAYFNLSTTQFFLNLIGTQ